MTAGQHAPLKFNKVLPEGSVLGAYRIDKLLGEGGMGFVYEASHTSLQRRCAIKVLRSQLAANRNMVARFLQEARAVNLISHDNIVSVFDFSDSGAAGVYFVMEYLEGETLADLHQRQPVMPLATLIHIFAQLTSALSAAHRSGVIHRDLKPANVFLVRRDSDPQYVKLLDFGVAKLRDVDRSLTVEGDLLGTPQYMSPEQIAGSLDVDHRSDIWALGVMMYRCATGQAPFNGDTFTAVATAVLQGELMAPSVANPSAELPVGFDQVVMKCLQSDPQGRWPSVMAVQSALLALRDTLGLGDSDHLQFVGDAAAKSSQQQGPASVMGQSLPMFQGAAAPSPPAQGQPATQLVTKAARPSQKMLFAAAAAVLLVGVGAVALLRDKHVPPTTSVVESAPSRPVLPAPRSETPAPDQLRAALLSNTVQTQIDAINALDTVGTAATVPLLELALQQGPEIKLRAAQALLRNRHSQSVAAIKKSMENSGAKIRNDLASAAFALGSQDTQAGLQRGLEDPSLRLGSAIALIDSKNPTVTQKAVEVLQTVLRDAPVGRESWSRAAAALAGKGDSDARDALRSELTQDDALRALNAATALAAADDDAGLVYLQRVVADDTYARRGQAALALMQSSISVSAAGSEAAMTWATGALKSSDADDRRLAIAVLARQQSPLDRAMLTTLLSTDSSHAVRLAAAAALLPEVTP